MKTQQKADRSVPWFWKPDPARCWLEYTPQQRKWRLPKKENKPDNAIALPIIILIPSSQAHTPLAAH